MEQFLELKSKILHPNHVILVDKKYNLAKMYGRMPGYEADKLTPVQLKRKMGLCKEVLEVLNKIMPGRTRKRGKIQAYFRANLID
jgi:hypothetical protein